MKTLAIGLVLSLALLSAVFVGVEAKTYKAVIKVNFADSCWDELYARISDSTANPKTGNHDILVGKFTLENPKHTITKVEKSFKFDPKKIPSGLMREYINLEKEGKVFYEDYKHPYTQFQKSRTQYTFTHNVPRTC